MIKIYRPELKINWSLALPTKDSHKGENGKVMIIGGSELFHAASRWSLDVASRLVDMVFYASVPSNNELIKQAKGEFWNGIVVERQDMHDYLVEADCILIGPGMDRTDETEQLTNQLLAAFPDKRWVIDAGALQMADWRLFGETMILTPHQGEWQKLVSQTTNIPSTVLLKNQEKDQTDEVLIKGELVAQISGGNPGLTKGGTGDCLAGLVAGLYARKNIDALAAATMASEVCKKAGDQLAGQVGPFFNATDLAEQIPYTLWGTIQDHVSTPDKL